VYTTQTNADAHFPFRFDEYDLNDSLMCLFRQCKNLGDDVLVKYHSRDSFQVQYQSYIFDFTSDKTGNHFKNPNFHAHVNPYLRQTV